MNNPDCEMKCLLPVTTILSWTVSTAWGMPDTQVSVVRSAPVSKFYVVPLTQLISVTISFVHK